MQLSLQSSYLSIKEFPNIELPRFTLVTGLNGTGKSHMLRGLIGQQIRCDIAPNPGNDIRFFDWTNMVPNDAGLFDGHSFIQEQNAMYEQFFNAKKQYEDQITSAARSVGLTGRILSNTSDIAKLNLQDISLLLGNQEQATEAYNSIKAAVDATSGNLLNNVAQNYHSRIRLISKEFDRPIAALERNDFFRSKLMPSWGQTTIFQHSFAQLFVAYRDLALSNAIRQMQKRKGRDVFCYSDEDFVKHHMAPPWEFVNESLATSGLDFKIDQPDEYDFTPYEPKLTKISSNAEVRFSDLSSGEKVLMSFALCLYFARDTRQLTTYPKLLLLDEIDAPLHPSMSRGLLNTIVNTLVQTHNIHVIATTHSPSTIALAPEEAIFAMKSGAPGLHKISKNEALNILTEGVPTLSVSFSGRRQVFVESPQDASLYDQLYQILKKKLASERSLDFVATGVKTGKHATDTNTGCDIVRHIVQNLSDTGNTSVFGLIDWDSKNTSDARIKVLAMGKRNGIENVILDPLLLSCLILNRFRNYLGALGITEDTSYIEFLNAQEDKLQSAIDSLESYIFGPSVGEKVDAEYCGGFKLKISKKYLESDDHDLESLLLEKFPNLKSIARGAGTLMGYVVSNIVRDKIEFLPIDIMESFREILQEDAH